MLPLINTAICRMEG